MYIPNGVDTTMFAPREFLVGYCGNKKPFSQRYKGVEFIQRAVAAINREGKIRVRFVQDPSDPPEKVYQQERIAKFYRTLDVFVSASIGEGCSNVVLEALASGVPVVMTKTGIWKELAGAGVLAVDRTVEAIKRGILQQLAPAIKARQEMASRYTWQAVAAQYVSLYTGLGYPPRSV